MLVNSLENALSKKYGNIKTPVKIRKTKTVEIFVKVSIEARNTIFMVIFNSTAKGNTNLNNE